MNDDIEIDIPKGEEKHKLPVCPPEYEHILRKYRAITYYFNGMTNNEIAEDLHINKGTISKWISKFNKNGSVVKHLPRSGRPIKIEDALKEQIKSYLKENNKITQNEIVYKNYMRITI
jgi:transposase